MHTEARLDRPTDLWGEPVSDGVHVVAGCRGAHESIGVAGEAVAIGRQAVGGAAVGAQTPLVHGGRRQGLGSVQRAALCHQEQHQQVREERQGNMLLCAEAWRAVIHHALSVPLTHS